MARKCKCIKQYSIKRIRGFGCLWSLAFVRLCVGVTQKMNSERCFRFYSFMMTLKRNGSPKFTCGRYSSHALRLVYSTTVRRRNESQRLRQNSWWQIGSTLNCDHTSAPVHCLNFLSAVFLRFYCHDVLRLLGFTLQSPHETSSKII